MAEEGVHACAYAADFVVLDGVVCADAGEIRLGLDLDCDDDPGGLTGLT